MKRRTSGELERDVRALLASGDLCFPTPGGGATPARHRLLAELGRQDLSLARISEAHTDAVSILVDAGRTPVANALYGVWAAETSKNPLRWERTSAGLTLNGVKKFCSGAGMVDRALITVREPAPLLIDVDVRGLSDSIEFCESGWITDAFAETNTATANFTNTVVPDDAFSGDGDWYLDRPGFWHGACGPAACWAGGALGLVDFAIAHSATDAHTFAHLGAMKSAGWTMLAALDSAGLEIDREPDNADAAQIRALMLRHVIEQLCQDILRRFGRAYGPAPLAFNIDASKRYHELELYLRQSHAERDLEVLGRCLQSPKPC